MDFDKFSDLSRLEDLSVLERNEVFCETFSVLEKQKLKQIFLNPVGVVPDLDLAVKISLSFKVALHPEYIFFWNELSVRDFLKFVGFLKFVDVSFQGDDFVLSFVFEKRFKRFLEIVGVEHFVFEENEFSESLIVLKNVEARRFLLNFNFYFLDKSLRESFEDWSRERFVESLVLLEKLILENLSLSVCEILSVFCDFEIRDKGGTYVGARMGRPEKAKMRRMDNSPTGIFPVCKESRSVNSLFDVYSDSKSNLISCEAKVFFCSVCDLQSVLRVCPKCGGRNEEMSFESFGGVREYKRFDVNLSEYVDVLLRSFEWESKDLPSNVKGVEALSSKSKFAEHLGKAFLRAKSKVVVNKDGTVRYDMTQAGITHFKPVEIGTSVKRLKELGYRKDYLGRVLTNKNQVLEIFPQDVILPDCDYTGDESALDFVLRVGSFVDDLLEKLYGLKRFYNFKGVEDTIGHLIVGLAPHTCAGIVGRIIGYSRTQCCFAHPLWHAAQRRNLDGDETSISLLFDVLLNFSKEFLPDRRGARTMDVPLVLTSKICVDQVDDEVWGMDIVDFYPLEFYKSAKSLDSISDLNLKSVKIRQVKDNISLGKRNRDDEFFNMKFTHSCENINSGVLFSSYKHVPSMEEKVNSQMDIAQKIRAVDENRTADILVSKYFLKDIKSNLSKFFVQDFKCSNCLKKFRRPPLNGKCTSCSNSKINFTMSKGFVLKYVEPSFKLVQRYDVSRVTVEKLNFVSKQIRDVFGDE